MLDNWGIGASFLAVAQTFLMIWHNQTSKCLYTLQHCTFQHLYILHLHCYCWFTACCWCAECSLLQSTHSTPAAVINQCSHRRWRTYKHWNVSVVMECYNVERHWKRSVIMLKGIGSHIVSALFEATWYAWNKDLSLLHNLQTGYGTNIQWPMGDVFPGNKPVRECGWPLVSTFLPCAWVKKAIPQLPHVLKTRCLKFKDNL